MEVHHHPDLHHKKKKFKEYFLEFLMIFLAVTLGFFAENIREHFSEKKTTQQYLESLRMELYHNKIIFNTADSLYTTRLPVEDSIVKIFLAKKENADLVIIARLINTSRSQYTPLIETSAYSQLVNSGGLKYINNNLKDALSKYESLVEGFKIYNTTVNNYMLTAFPNITSIDDLSDNIHQEPNHIFTISPYPELTARERREITNYYAYHFIRTYSNQENVRRLINAEDHLISIVAQ